MANEKKKNTVLGFMIIYTFFQITSGFIHPVVPTLIVDRGFHSYMFGVILAAMSLANFIFSPFWGNLCNYMPTKYIMFICSIGYIIGQLMFGFAKTEATIVLARIISGIFFGGITVSTLNYVINTSGEYKSVNLIAASTIQGVGFAMGYFIGGLFGELSVIIVFYAQAIGMTVCALLFIFYCKKDDGIKREIHRASLLVKESNPFSVFISANKFITGILITFFVCVFIACFGQVSFDQSFNYYLKDIFDMSPIYNGIVRAASAVLSLLINSTIGILLLKKTNQIKSFICLLGLCSLLMFTMFLFRTMLIYIIINVLSLSLSALRAPLQQDILLSKTKEETSNVIMGFYQSVSAIASMVAALIAGFTYDLWNKLPFLLGGVCLAVSAFIAIHILKRQNKTVQ